MTAAVAARPVRVVATAASARPGSAQLATEVALFLVTLSAAFGFCRVFEGWSFLPPLVSAAVASHGTVMLCRRRGWGMALTGVTSTVALALLASWTFFRATTRFGVPTRRTWHASGTQLVQAWHDFSTAIPPVPATGGFIVAGYLAVWMAAFLADGFAFRARATIEMLLPSALLFVFASALSRPRHRVLSTVVWMMAAAAAVVLHRSYRQETASGWLTSHRRGATAAAARVGMGLGAAAIAAAIVLWPALPGAGQQALINTHNDSGGVREVLSPLVNIRGRITQRTDLEAFTVKSSAPSYWKLVSLSDFNGQTWRSDRGYGSANGRLGGGLPNEVTKPVTQTVTIANLADNPYIPAAYVPVSIDTKLEVRYDAETSTLVTHKGDVKKGDTFVVQSRVPNLTPAQIKERLDPNDTADDRYLVLPSDLRVGLRELGQQIIDAAGAVDDFDKALALERWFTTNFTYDLNVAPGQSASAIDDFLQARKGYCEQFSGTYAAIARAIGLPARVAVGFTPGQLGSDGLYHVLGKYAHAWPEVYLGGIGWLPFEPTPSRGNPDATSYDGIAPAQAGQPAATATTTTVATGPSTSGGGAGASTIPKLKDPKDVANPGSTRILRRPHQLPTWLRNGLVALGAAMVVVLLWWLVAPRLARLRWRRRRQRATTPSERILVDWHETTAALTHYGRPRQSGETPLEYARRVDRASALDGTTLPTLAEHVTLAAYAGVDLPAQMADEASAAQRSLTSTVRQRMSRRARLRWSLDPRTLLEPLPGDADYDALSSGSVK